MTVSEFFMGLCAILLGMYCGKTWFKIYTNRWIKKYGSEANTLKQDIDRDRQKRS